METPSPPVPEDAAPRAGRCVIVGRPNVGKSTLVNALLGQKLVITTPTPGTTRSCVLGVHVSKAPPTQIALLDTPGLGRPRTALAGVLAEQTKQSLTDADVLVFMTETTGRRRPPAVHPLDEAILKLVRGSGRPAILAVNKVDRLDDKRLLLPFIEAYTARHEFAAVVPLSAARREGLDALLGEIRARLPQGRLYDDDYLTDRPEQFFVAELVREAALLQTREEVPHGVAVWIEDWSEQEGLAHIAATIAVEKPNHKKIVIGSRGSRIKAIGTAAREEIEQLLDRKVFLQLWVKVVPGWTSDTARARRMLEGGGP